MRRTNTDASNSIPDLEETIREYCSPKHSVHGLSAAVFEAPQAPRAIPSVVRTIQCPITNANRNLGLGHLPLNENPSILQAGSLRLAWTSDMLTAQTSNPVLEAPPGQCLGPWSVTSNQGQAQDHDLSVEAATRLIQCHIVRVGVRQNSITFTTVRAWMRMSCLFH